MTRRRRSCAPSVGNRAIALRPARVFRRRSHRAETHVAQDGPRLRPDDARLRFSINAQNSRRGCARLWERAKAQAIGSVQARNRKRDIVQVSNGTDAAARFRADPQKRISVEERKREDRDRWVPNVLAGPGEAMERGPSPRRPRPVPATARARPSGAWRMRAGRWRRWWGSATRHWRVRRVLRSAAPGPAAVGGARWRRQAPDLLRVQIRWCAPLSSSIMRA